jgi:RNA polymerase sigma-70 factor (ECF subfamily)
VDHEGFEGWYLVEHPRVIGVLAAVSGDRDASIEAADEAFARALSQWKRVRRMDAPGAWTCEVALNALRRAMRRRTLENRAIDRLGAPTPVPPTDVDLWQVVRQLPERQRTAVALRYIGDFSEPVIAEMMGIRRGTVAATLFEARRRLGEMLETEPDQSEASDA